MAVIIGTERGARIVFAAEPINELPTQDYVETPFIIQQKYKVDGWVEE